MRLQTENSRFTCLVQAIDAGPARCLPAAHARVPVGERRSIRWRWIAFAFITAIAFSTGPAGATGYKLTDLGVVGSDDLAPGQVSGITSDGVVVLYNSTPEGFIWTPTSPNASTGIKQTIPAADVLTDCNLPVAVNDLRHALCSSSNYIWLGGTSYTTLANVNPAFGSQVHGINNLDGVIGTGVNDLFDFHATWWPSGGAPVQLESRNSDGYGLNNTGLFVGRIQEDDGVHSHAAAWQFLGSPFGFPWVLPVTLQHDVGDDSEARDVGDDGTIVGRLGVPSVPVVWEAWTVRTSLPVLSGGGGAALAINSKGAGVGYSYEYILPREGEGRRVPTATLWTRSGNTWTVTDLNTVTTDLPDGWYLEIATAVNDFGQIGGRTAGGHAFLLTPVMDSTPPTTTAAASPAPNLNGWNNTNVTVNLNATDDTGGSGVKEIEYTLTGAHGGGGLVGGSVASVTIATEGITTLTYFARDNAGNQEAAKTLTVRIDTTPPTVTATQTPAPNANGWNNTDVTVAGNGTDSLSGIASCTSITLTTEGAGQLATVSCTDKAGNAASAATTVNIDTTPPTVACSVNPTTLWPPNHKMVGVTAAVAVTDPLAGSAGFTLMSATSSEPDNGLGDGDTPHDIQGFDLGVPDISGLLRAERSGNGTGRVYTLTYGGTDLAGNSATCSATVTVPHNTK